MATEAVDADEQVAVGDAGVRSAAALTRRVLTVVRTQMAGEPIAALLATVYVGSVTAYRLGAIRNANYPGHADPSFHYGVAQNIHNGQGATINYVWEYIDGQPALRHYAFDYWLPLPSALMSVALNIRDSLSAALSVNVAMSVLLAIATYLFTRAVSPSRWAPAAASALVIVQPVVTRYAVQAEAPLYLGAFSVLAMAAAIGARKRPWLWLVVGVLAGLANLSRSEGLLLFAVLIVAAVAWTRPGRRLRYAGATAVGYLATMSPLYIMSMRNIGTPMPPAAGKVAFIGKYEDLYALHTPRTVSTLLGGSLGHFFKLRATTFATQLSVALGAFYVVDAVAVVALIGVALPRLRASALADGVGDHLKAALRSPWFVPVAFVATMFAFDALVTPVVASGGASAKGMASTVPVLCAAAMAQLARLGLRAATTLAIVAVLAGAPLIDLAAKTRLVVDSNNRTGAHYAALTPLLKSEAACLGKPVVIMTRLPWELTQATGVPSVQIPTAPLGDILAVAHRYGVTDIEIDPRRSALRHTTALLSANGPLAPSAVLQGKGIYRIKSEVGQPDC